MLVRLRVKMSDPGLIMPHKNTDLTGIEGEQATLPSGSVTQSLRVPCT